MNETTKIELDLTKFKRVNKRSKTLGAARVQGIRLRINSLSPSNNSQENRGKSSYIIFGPEAQKLMPSLKNTGRVHFHLGQTTAVRHLIVVEPALATDETASFLSNKTKQAGMSFSGVLPLDLVKDLDLTPGVYDVITFWRIKDGWLAMDYKHMNKMRNAT